MANLPNSNVYAKLEYCNPTGSVKDRAASYIINTLLNDKTINSETTIIESTSGNFGIALSAYCRKFGLRFIAVIDPNILPVNEMLIRSQGAEIIKVTASDANDGYLLSRIAKVKELLSRIGNSYWVNQYGNPLNARAYYNTLAEEICQFRENIDYLFIGVSSGGTITGVSQKVKQRFPNVKIIAVDIVGSVVFGGLPKKRFIPGIGSSMRPEILKEACIDDFIMVDENEVATSCRELLREEGIFAGGSSGAVISAIKKYFKGNCTYKNENDVMTIFPDRGDRYVETVYNDDWCFIHLQDSKMALALQ